MSVKSRPVESIHAGSSEVAATSANTTGQASEILDIQVPAGHRYEFPTGHGIEMYIPVHEQISGAGTGTNTQSLSEDLVDSPAVADVPTGVDNSTARPGQYSLVVWDGQEQHQSGVNAVSYANDTFDYNNQSGSPSDLEVYYLWGNPAQVEFRHYQPDEEEYEKVHQKTMREFHVSNVFNEDSRVEFPRSVTLGPKHHLKVYITTDVDLTDWDVEQGDGAAGTPGSGYETYSYYDFDIPVRRRQL